MSVIRLGGNRGASCVADLSSSMASLDIPHLRLGV